MCFKKRKVAKRGIFWLVRNVCVFQLPFAQPPVRRSVAFSFIVFMSHVHNASPLTHPHDVETSVSQGGAGVVRGAPEMLLANQGSSLTTQGF